MARPYLNENKKLHQISRKSRNRGSLTSNLTFLGLGCIFLLTLLLPAGKIVRHASVFAQISAGCTFHDFRQDS